MIRTLMFCKNGIRIRKNAFTIFSNLICNWLKKFSFITRKKKCLIPNLQSCFYANCLEKEEKRATVDRFGLEPKPKQHIDVTKKIDF